MDAAPPIDILFDKEYLFPIYKEGAIYASNIFTDLSGAYNYYWDVGMAEPKMKGVLIYHIKKIIREEFGQDMLQKVVDECAPDALERGDWWPGNC